MNILVFGKDGQLGRAFQSQFWQSRFEIGNAIRFVGRNDCDLCNTVQITALLEDFKPHLIINAAAYTAVDKAELNSDIAFAVNAIAPGVMANYAAKHGATFIHFSTDYVFNGAKDDVYIEVDKTDPLSVYGKSKEEGEIAITNAFSESCNQSGQYAILRTSWVYGDGGNFIRSILRLAKERSALRVIDDQFGVPTSAIWLADLVLNLVLEDSQLRRFSSGIYHAVPLGKTNWHGIACLAVKAAMDFGWKLQTPLNQITPIPASEYPLPAPRPMNSRLSRKKLELELNHLGIMSKLPHWNTPWDEQVCAYIKQLDAN